MSAGFIYLLASPNCASIKIGRTEQVPAQRLRQINASTVYEQHGPWDIVDLVEVNDVVNIETFIHRSLDGQRNRAIAGQNELFDITIPDARNVLRDIPKDRVVGYPELAKCFVDPILSIYLDRLYTTSGMSTFFPETVPEGENRWVPWTLSLFPPTGGGRYFTMNIGSHEVAFSSTPRRGSDGRHRNELVVDRLVLDFPEVKNWVRNQGGKIRSASYETSRERATSIDFDGTLTDCLELLTLPGVRRALIGYWIEGLLELREAKKSSTYARYHNWNAANELQRRASGYKSTFAELIRQ